MTAARIGGVFCVLLLAGCAGIERAPQSEVPPATAPSAATVAVGPSVAPATSAPPSEPPQAIVVERGTVVAEPMVPPAVPVTPIASGPTNHDVAKPETSTTKAPIQAPRAPPPATQLPQKEAPAPALAKPETPPLDLKSLETRLKETKAIGVFTKLALKNQVDDLLDQFRAFYLGRLKTSLSELRRSYDLLVLKVLALLQDADPPLANAIAASRESIWGILSNPAKFAAV